MKMTYLNYPGSREMLKDLGVNFEHQNLTCSVSLILPNDDEIALGLMLCIHDRLERNIWDLSPERTYCLSEIMRGIAWQGLTEMQQILAPKCVDFLIEYQAIPLVRDDDLRAPHVSMYRLKYHPKIGSHDVAAAGHQMKDRANEI